MLLHQFSITVHKFLAYFFEFFCMPQLDLTIMLILSSYCIACSKTEIVVNIDEKIDIAVEFVNMLSGYFFPVTKFKFNVWSEYESKFQISLIVPTIS